MSERAAPVEMRFAIQRDTGLRRGFLYGLAVYFSRLMGLVLFRIRVFGIEKVPSEGATILAGNHQSVLDPWLIGSTPDRCSCYLAKDSLFRVPLLGPLIRLFDAFPIPRERVASRRAIQICIDILRKDRALILFPEGSRSEDGRLQPLKRGVGMIAKRTAAVIQPVLILGSRSCWPRGALLPRPGKIRIYFGDPIQLECNETSDSLIARLADCYRQMALEAGAADMLGDEAGTGEGPERGKEPLPSPETHGEEVTPSRSAGNDSLVACATPSRWNGLCLSGA